jgi:hypothetical protein
MRIETHEEAFETHRRAIFKWALEVEGIEKSQRIIGLHASRGITELLSIFLHKNRLIDEGFQLNHRWFKSERVTGKLPEFSNKKGIVGKMVKLENLCETLAYGAPKSVGKTEEAINLFRDIEEMINRMLWKEKT